MTNAHRPTWKAAVGGSEQGGNTLYIPTRQYSSRDMPSHLKLKTRQEGQGTEGEANKVDFRRNILEREQQHFREKNKKGYEEDQAEEIPEIEDKLDAYSLEKCLETIDKGEKKRRVEEEQNPFPQDSDADLSAADEAFNALSNKTNNVNGNEGDEAENNEAESDDDEAELMREFEKIKKEREEEQKRKVTIPALNYIGYRKNRRTKEQTKRRHIKRESYI